MKKEEKKSSINVSLDKKLKDFVDHVVESEGYCTTSAYITELIRNDWKTRNQNRLVMILETSEVSGTLKKISEDLLFSKVTSLRRTRVKIESPFDPQKKSPDE